MVIFNSLSTEDNKVTKMSIRFKGQFQTRWGCKSWDVAKAVAQKRECWSENVMAFNMHYWHNKN